MKNYFYEIKKNYSIMKLLKVSVVISFGLLILDIIDMPSNIITKYGFFVILFMSIAIAALIALTVIDNGLIDMFEIPSINQVEFTQNY